jgi:hypothetical protein
MLAQKRISGKIYPDRSFSLGFIKKKTLKESDRKYERDLSQQPEVDDNAVIDWLTERSTVGGKFRSISEAPLFIKGAKSSREIRGSYGKHGITGFGKRVVKNGALLLERKYGKARLGFVTCTLPTFPEDIQKGVNAHWSEITRRFYQKVKRQLKKVSQPFIYTGVTEIQEKRFKNYGMPVPHIHFVYLSRSNSRSKYWIYICHLHRAWNEAIGEVLNTISPDFVHGRDSRYASVHAKRVQKSASAYLGKYMTKGCNVCSKMKEQGWEEFPKQWWTACMQTKKMFRESIIHIDDRLGLSFFYDLEHYLHEGLITWGRFVEVLIDNEYRRIGLVGTLSKGAYDLIASA